LYVSERDEANEMVTGFRAGTELAKQLTGVDETKDIESLAEDIKQYAKVREKSSMVQPSGSSVFPFI